MLSAVRQTIQKYDMIQNGDQVAVAISGGKDSFVLLHILNMLKNFFPEKFSVAAIYLDIGFEKNNFSVIKEYCYNYNIPFHSEKSIIKQVVFDEKKIQNPCSLCSKMRRAALCNIAKSNGYNKIALGHNKDDAIETFIMNLFFNGKIECFEPKTHYENIDITIIRPIININENRIISFFQKQNLPKCEKLCPIDGKTKRENTKKFISSLAKKNPKIKERIYSAIEKLDTFSSKEKDV